MRLYKIEAEIENQTDGNGSSTKSLTWHGTNADCVARRKELKDLGARQKDIYTTEVDVPTDKAGLIAFLNKMGDE